MNKTMLKTVIVTLVVVAAASRTAQGKRYLLGQSA